RAEAAALRMGSAHLAADDVKLGLSLAHGCGWLQTADGKDRVAPASGLLRQRKGQQHLHFGARCKHRVEIERRWQDTHHFGRFAIEGDRASDDAWIAVEILLPERMTEQRRFAPVPDALLV